MNNHRGFMLSVLGKAGKEIDITVYYSHSQNIQFPHISVKLHHTIKQAIDERVQFIKSLKELDIANF